MFWLRRMWFREGGYEAVLEEMTFEVSTKDREWLDVYCHTIMSLALAGEGNASLTFLEAPADYLFTDNFLHWRTHCLSIILTVLHFLIICNPDSHSPVGFECQRGNPAWRLFWYCWTLSWKTFLLSDQGCSGFRAIGSSAETPHLITAVRLFEEP